MNDYKKYSITLFIFYFGLYLFNKLEFDIKIPLLLFNT